MSYRFDSRSKDEFVNDIKDCTVIERKLMEIYVSWLNSTKKNKYTFSDNGVDNSGKFIEDDNKIHTSSDFILHTEGKRDKKIEIKFCRPLLPRFHLKINQIKKYISTDTCIVNFMGIESETPKFCILTPSMLQEYLNNGNRVVMWHKECIRFNCKDQKWIDL